MEWEYRVEMLICYPWLNCDGRGKVEGSREAG